MNFPTRLDEILGRVYSIEPNNYASTRNYIDGSVTYLSPYISRGVISTKQVFESVIKRGFDPYHINKFLQELAWRDYWQQAWVIKGSLINNDLKHEQSKVRNHLFPTVIEEAISGITAIDIGINDLYELIVGCSRHIYLFYLILICPCME